MSLILSTCSYKIIKGNQHETGFKSQRNRLLQIPFHICTDKTPLVAKGSDMKSKGGI